MAALTTQVRYVVLDGAEQTRFLSPGSSLTFGRGASLASPGAGVDVPDPGASVLMLKVVSQTAGTFITYHQRDALLVVTDHIGRAVARLAAGEGLALGSDVTYTATVAVPGRRLLVLTVKREQLLTPVRHNQGDLTNVAWNIRRVVEDHDGPQIVIAIAMAVVYPGGPRSPREALRGALGRLTNESFTDPRLQRRINKALDALRLPAKKDGEDAVRVIAQGARDQGVLSAPAITWLRKLPWMFPSEDSSS